MINAHFNPAKLKDLLALVIIIPTSFASSLTDKNGKKIKEAVAEESSSEISTSTLITDEGSGKINQQALSSATKKTCESLINKLLFNKK